MADGAGAGAGEGWSGWLAGRIETVRGAGQWREIRSFDTADIGARRGAWSEGDSPHATGGVVQGWIESGGGHRAVVSFAGNDYLGLSRHPAVVHAARAALGRWGTGAGAARLVTGSRPVHHDLEAALANWKRSERALLFPTGYQANLGVLSCLADDGARIVSDALNHASIVDGSRLARADVAVFQHLDLDHAEDLVAEARSAGRRVVVISDTVFSMDGDLADVAGLVAMAARCGALLVLDEAHAVLGPELDEDLLAAAGEVPVLRVGTLSKTLGSVGGFVAGPAGYVDYLINRARPFIFTTATPPADAAAALAAIEVLGSEEGHHLRQRLRAHVDRVRPGHPSPIVPIVIGDEGAAMAAAEALLERGLLVPAIRPPTVATGSSRLRVTLSAAHDDRHVDALLAALSDLGLAPCGRGSRGKGTE